MHVTLNCYFGICLVWFFCGSFTTALFASHLFIFLFFFFFLSGPSNYNGMAVFDCVPAQGTIGPGKARKEMKTHLNFAVNTCLVCFCV